MLPDHAAQLATGTIGADVQTSYLSGVCDHKAVGAPAIATPQQVVLADSGDVHGGGCGNGRGWHGCGGRGRRASLVRAPRYLGAILSRRGSA
jgi:hypothetical protein